MYNLSKDMGQRLLNISIFVSALIGVALSIKNQTVLWILPMAFLIVYTIFFVLFRVRFNWCVGIIIGVSFLRYSILPVLYTAGLDSSFVSYLSYNFNHLSTTIVVMIVEMLGLFCGVYFADRKVNHSAYEKTYEDSLEIEYYSKTPDVGIASTVIVLLGLGLLITHPSLIRGVNQVIVSKDSISGSIEAVFQVSIIVFAISLLYRIKKSLISEKVRVIASIIVFSGLIFLSSNMATSSSRNCLIINTIILLIYMNRNYSNLSKRMIPGILVFAGVFFCISSYNRFSSYQVSSNVVVAVFNSMFGYQVLNAYFAGPTNIDVGLSMINDHGGIIGPGQFFTDFFANVPFVNKLFSDVNTVTMYNQTMSHGIANDQIVPLTIQSIAYGSYALTPLLVFISSYFSVRMYYKASNAENDLILYSYSYIAIVLAMSTMLCVNSMSMLIIMRVVPVLIIGRLNRKLVVRWRK